MALHAISVFDKVYKWIPQIIVVVFSHRYIDSDGINFKTFVFLAVYWSIWTSSYNTDIIKVQQFFNGASTMLNNVFKANG